MAALEREVYEQQRRRWRKGAFWRGFVVAVLLGGIVALIVNLDAIRPERDHIARFQVNGLITDDAARDALLRDLAENDAVRAVILRINSPGGTAAGSEALFEALRRIAEEKPVVAVLSEVAASGGYIAALGADHIVGRANTLTGSIGVIMEYPDITELLENWGIGVETVRSSELKGEPAPWRPTTPAARAREEQVVADSFSWFRDLVAERRGLSGAALERVADGSVVTGRLALEAGLIDAIGGEAEGRDWLESRDADLAGLPTIDHAVPRTRGLAGLIFGQIPAADQLFADFLQAGGPRLYSLAR